MQNQRRTPRRPVQGNYRGSRARIMARKKKRLKIILAFVALLLLIIILVGSCGNSDDKVNSFSEETIQAAQRETEFEKTMRTYTAKPTQMPVREIVQATKVPTRVPTQIPTKTPTPTEAVSIGKRNALSSARTYLEYMAFSYVGLGKQLMYEGYTKEEAKYAVDNCGANWNEQAAKSAATYLEYMSFSRSGLIEQLEYEGYTHEQAVYGVSQVGY